MNKCPEIQRQNKFTCAQMMIIAQALRLIVLHLSVFELRIKDEVNNWWNVGFCWLSSLTALTNERTLRPCIDQSEAAKPLSTYSLLTNLMCKCCAGMDPTFLGQIHIKARILVTQAALGAEETLLSLSKQIISQVLSGKFVFSHTFTRFRCIISLLVETLSSLC